MVDENGGCDWRMRLENEIGGSGSDCGMRLEDEIGGCDWGMRLVDVIGG